jgi:hypothetical protein
MSLPSAAAAVAALAVAASLLTGCGETVIDDVKTEEALEKSLRDSTGSKITAVECPSGVEVEAGSTFECDVVLAGGERETATLKIVNDDADVSIVSLESATPPKGE